MRRLLALASAAGLVATMAPAAAAGEVKLEAAMTGEAEVPDPGPEGGTGMAELLVNPEAGELCYRVATGEIGEPTAAHVHRGGAGEAGDITVDLRYADNGPEACVQADPDTLEHILDDPAGHYVNVHTADNPGGAVRGQLKRSRERRRQAVR